LPPVLRLAQASTISSSTIKYAFIGNANRCLSGCAAQTTGPNGNAVIAHEIEETNTSPLPISGWADSQGAENGDKCAWTFGQNLHLVNGAYYNMILPGISLPARNYLVQRGDRKTGDSIRNPGFSDSLNFRDRVRAAAGLS
jgi:hypothetical protein